MGMQQRRAEIETDLHQLQSILNVIKSLFGI